MTTDLTALARRVVASKHWRWMLGMQAVSHDGLFGHRVTEHTLVIDPDALPDLEDPATRGCLLALLREALGYPEAHAYYASMSEWWVVRLGSSGRTVCAPTEVEALVAAWEAAP